MVTIIQIINCKEKKNTGANTYAVDLIRNNICDEDLQNIHRKKLSYIIRDERKHFENDS